VFVAASAAVFAAVLLRRPAPALMSNPKGGEP
jgi:hypothetical protein